MADTDRFSVNEILARTVYGEARGEPYAGQKAVACVVINRVNSGIRWWGQDVKSVCLKPYQFSCWLESDPNRPKIMDVAETDPVYRRCLTLAELATEGLLVDNTGGADSYEAIGTNAKWAAGHQPTVIIGKHAFFKLNA